MQEVLIVIDGGYFYAGLVAQNGKVVEVAPILRRHIKRGWTGRQVADLCAKRKWAWERVHTVTS